MKHTAISWRFWWFKTLGRSETDSDPSKVSAGLGSSINTIFKALNKSMLFGTDICDSIVPVHLVRTPTSYTSWKPSLIIDLRERLYTADSLKNRYENFVFAPSFFFTTFFVYCARYNVCFPKLWVLYVNKLFITVASQRVTLGMMPMNSNIKKKNDHRYDISNISTVYNKI